MTAEENLARLKKTAILMSFVKKQNGSWGHDEWVSLCEDITAKGYDPIDFDQVGVLLEEKKAKYLNT